MINSFQCQLTNGLIEGTNNKLKLSKGRLIVSITLIISRFAFY
ncbi:hypothetical protein [Lactobacillus apis]